jgi:hypothetical protein
MISEQEMPDSDVIDSLNSPSLDYENRLVHQNIKYDGSCNWWESEWFKIWEKLAGIH